MPGSQTCDFVIGWRMLELLKFTVAGEHHCLFPQTILFFPNSVSQWGLQPRKDPVCTGAGAGQDQRGSGEDSEGSAGFGAEGSGEGLGGFGAEPGQIQHGSGEGSGRLSCRARSNKVPEKAPEKVCGALVQSQVRFNRVPEKVPEKVLEKVGRLWCRARSGSTEFRRRFRRRLQEALVKSQVRFNGFRRRLQKPSQVSFI